MAWITGDKTRLRAWERDDVRLRWEADQTDDVTEIRLRDWHEPPRSLEQRLQEYDAAIAEPDPSNVRLIIEAEGRVVGDIDLFEIDQRNRRASVGLSIWSPADRNKGYGADAMRALLRWAFAELNLHRVELAVDPANEPAIHVYEKLGFRREGCRRQSHFDAGRYIDELQMGLLRDEFSA